MFLRAEQYEQIVASLRSERNLRRSRENRTSARVGLRVPVRVIPCRRAPRAKVHIAWLRDLSVGGAGLVMEEPIKPGTYLVMPLEREDGSSLELLFTVRRCESLASDQFAIGAAFDRVISAEDVK